MNRTIQWVLAAILICGASLFTSCADKEDNPVTDKTANKIIGTWVAHHVVSGMSPNTKLAYDNGLEIYQINADGTGFYECVFMNGDMPVDKTYDRYINGCFTYQVIGNEELLCTGIVEGDQWRLKYENGILVDYEDPAYPTSYNKCSPEDILMTQRAGLLGTWTCVYDEGGETPELAMPFDRYVESYFFAPDGTSFYECLYFMGDKLLETEYDRAINGSFTYEWISDELLLCVNTSDDTDQWLLTFKDGVLTDEGYSIMPSIYTKTTFDETIRILRSGVLGVWRAVYEEGGTTPSQKVPYDRQIEAYYFAPDGTGFFESLYFIGELLVEKEADRNSNGSFTYEWTGINEIICTSKQSGVKWKVTYDRGVLTDLAEEDGPYYYSKLSFEEELAILNMSPSE